MQRSGVDAAPEDVVSAVLQAGVDTDCGGGTTPNWSNTTLLRLLRNATTSPRITPLVDQALERLFTVRMRCAPLEMSDCCDSPRGPAPTAVADLCSPVCLS
jgi:hypothetical protein